MGKVKKKSDPPMLPNPSGTTSPQPGPSRIQDSETPTETSAVMMDTTDSHTSPISLTSATAAPDASQVQIANVPLMTKFVITESEDFSSSIEALLALEKEFPSLQVSTKITPKGDYILQAKDNDSLLTLQNAAVLSNGKTVAVNLYDPLLKITKMVLEGYPIGFPMDHLENHPLVESSTRLRVRTSKEITRQVLVTLRGEPPAELHLGIFGRYILREYYRCRGRSPRTGRRSE